MNGAIVTLMEGRQQYQGCSTVVGAMAVVAAAARQWRPNNQLKMGVMGRSALARTMTVEDATTTTTTTMASGDDARRYISTFASAVTTTRRRTTLRRYCRL